MTVTVQYPILDARELYNVKIADPKASSSFGLSMYSINGDSKVSYLNRVGACKEDSYTARRAIRFPNIENYASSIGIGSKWFSPQVKSRLFKSVRNFESYFEVKFFHHVKKLDLGSRDVTKLVRYSFLKTCLSIDSSIPSADGSLSRRAIIGVRKKVKELYYYATTPRNSYALIVGGDNPKGKNYDTIGSEYIYAGLPIAVLEAEVSKGYSFDQQTLICEIEGESPVRVHQLTHNDKFVSWLITYSDKSSKEIVEKIKNYIFFVHRFNESREFLCRFALRHKNDLTNKNILFKLLKIIDSKLTVRSCFNCNGAYDDIQAKIFNHILFPTEEKVEALLLMIKEVEDGRKGLNLFQRLLTSEFYAGLLSSLKDKPALHNSVLTVEELVKAIKKRNFSKVKTLAKNEVSIATSLIP